MSFSIPLSPTLKEELISLWALSSDAELLDMTAFGDFFVRCGEQYLFYSLTDASITDVSAEIKEFGLPPVSIELGDEWYQLDAQSALAEEGIQLAEGECFGFITALTQGGEYSLANIQAISLLEYHRAAHERGLSSD